MHIMCRIARRYGTTVDALARTNSISNPNRIFAGNSLIIPDTSTSSPVSAPQPVPQKPADNMTIRPASMIIWIKLDIKGKYIAAYNPIKLLLFDSRKSIVFIQTKNNIF